MARSTLTAVLVAYAISARSLSIAERMSNAGIEGGPLSEYLASRPPDAEVSDSWRRLWEAVCAAEWDRRRFRGEYGLFGFGAGVRKFVSDSDPWSMPTVVEMAPGSVQPGVARWLWRIASPALLREHEATVLWRLAARRIGLLAAAPPRSFEESIERLSRDLANLPFSAGAEALEIRLLIENLDGTATYHRALLANIRALRVSVALAAYRSAKGGYPQRLDELVPEFMAALPVEPFSETGAFGYRRFNDPGSKGYLLYSFGFDGVDNLGTQCQIPFSALLPGGSGADFVFVLSTPKMRRQSE